MWEKQAAYWSAHVRIRSSTKAVKGIKDWNVPHGVKHDGFAMMICKPTGLLFPKSERLTG